jgi:hypothetical protein
MTLAVWLALAPLRLLAALGLRRSLILACLFVLAVTAYGVAQDLGLLDPPAAAKPIRRARRRRRAWPPAPTSPPATSPLPNGGRTLPRAVVGGAGRHRQG